MGADYMAARIALAQHSNERAAKLNALIDTLDDQDFKEFWDMEGGLPDPDSQEEEDAAVAAGYVDETSMAVYVSRQRYKEWAEEYWDLDGRRDCGVSRQPDGLQFIESGGMTWGNDPTESFRVISCLDYVEKIVSQLVVWAKQDAGCDYEIHRCLILSSGHITAEDVKQLESATKDSRVLASINLHTKGEYGWYIYTGIWLDEKDLGRPLGVSDTLWGLMQIAISQKCHWLVLDCDGPERADLPQFDW